MSFSFNGAKAQVNITGGLTTQFPTAGTSQTARGYSSRPALTGAYSTLLTPTAGKVYYMTSLYIEGNVGAIVTIADNSTEVFEFNAKAGDGACLITFPTPIPFATTVRAKISVDGSAAIALWGFEQ